MLKCKEVYERSSDYLDGELGLWDRMQMRLHLAMCRHCSKLMDQLRYVQGATREAVRGEAPAAREEGIPETVAYYEAKCAARSDAPAADVPGEAAGAKVPGDAPEDVAGEGDPPVEGGDHR